MFDLRASCILIALGALSGGCSVLSDFASFTVTGRDATAGPDDAERPAPDTGFAPDVAPDVGSDAGFDAGFDAPLDAFADTVVTDTVVTDTVVTDTVVTDTVVTDTIVTDTASQCPTGEQRCAGQCINVQTSPQHCGACGNRCAVANAAPACAAGACTISVCNPGFENCDGDPRNGCETDINTSDGNCGGCGVTCALQSASSRCEGGQCRLTQCNSGFRDCDQIARNGCEISVLSNVNHCARCGNACASGPNSAPVCNGGACALTCAQNFGDCNARSEDGCEVNLLTSASHCGRCGNSCGGNQRCSNGSCVSACSTGETDCNGVCANLASNPDHCGACGRACPEVQNGTRNCSSGVCAPRCTNDQTACQTTGGLACVDTARDPNHCGRCDARCPSGQVCANGTCQSCNAPNIVCNQTCVDPRSDNINCGACGTVCNRATCSAGVCLQCTTFATACNGRCVNLLEDHANCGVCGRQCSFNQICATGTCTGCRTGLIACNNTCVDTTTDNANCGRCGRVCGGLQCIRSQCV